MARRFHLLRGKRRHTKVLLHGGLCRRRSVDFAIAMDEGQALALFTGAGFLHGPA